MQNRRAGHWQTALRRLHAKGYTDSALAEALCDLSDAAILTLESTRWNRTTIAAALVPGSGAPWTTRMVRYHRTQLGLSANAEPDPVRLARGREASWREQQRRHGWGWLLALDPPVTLSPRESEVLALLRDRGPLTRGDICATLGLDRNALDAGGHNWRLSCLAGRGLIQPLRWHNRRRVWTLAGLVADPYAGVRA